VACLNTGDSPQTPQFVQGSSGVVDLGSSLDSLFHVSHQGGVAAEDGCGARGLNKTSCAGNEKEKAII
jgi:hypothetical protein